jgi:hypothetical protein
MLQLDISVGYPTSTNSCTIPIFRSLDSRDKIWPDDFVADTHMELPLRADGRAAKLRLKLEDMYAMLF